MINIRLFLLQFQYLAGAAFTLR